MYGATEKCLFVAPIVWWSVVFDTCFVFQYIVSFSSFSIIYI